MANRYVCSSCLESRDSGAECPQCGGEERVDLEVPDQREELVERLEDEARSRRNKFVWTMEAFAVLACAALLVVGMAVGSALGGTALEWGVKLVAVALLAVCWQVIPVVYRRHLTGRPARLLAELEGRDGE